MLTARWGLLAFLLVGCATASGSTPAERLAALKEFTADDAAHALAILTAGGDAAGVQCFSYLVLKIEALQAEVKLPTPPTKPPGLLTTFATVRVAIHGKDTGPDQLAELDLHCAALRTSLEIDAAKGAMLGASLAASGGADAPAALGKVMPMLMRLLKGAGG